MTKGLQQIQFLCFAIICKRQYVNSVVLGSINQISIKVGVTDYQTRKQINYGLKNGLITKVKGGYLMPSYKNLLEHLNLSFDSKHMFIVRFGNFNELVERNLYSIARNNFKQQQFNIKRNDKLRLIYNKIETDYHINKKDLKTFKQYFTKSVLSSEKSIVTGQKAIARILGISQTYANQLLKRWNDLFLIKREIVFSKDFNRYEDSNRLLRLEIGNYICLGSKVLKFV